MKNISQKISLVLITFTAGITMIAIVWVATQGNASLYQKAVEDSSSTCTLQATAPTLIPTLTPSLTPTGTLIPTLTPTSTPRITITPTPQREIKIQGRIYFDNDERFNGRGGFTEDPLGPAAWDLGNNLDWHAFVACGAGGPMTIDIATWGKHSESWALRNVNYNPNFKDVCNNETFLERSTTGWVNETESWPTNPHPAIYGGYSFTIDPVTATVEKLGGIDYYVVRLTIPAANSCVMERKNQEPLIFGDWVITETFWADTTAHILPPQPIPTGSWTAFDSPYRGLTCNYNWQPYATPTPGKLVEGPVVCNRCFGDEAVGLRLGSAKTCDVDAFDHSFSDKERYCELTDYAPERDAIVLIPVEGPQERNLWIGVNKREIVRSWPQYPETDNETEPVLLEEKLPIWRRLLKIVGY